MVNNISYVNQAHECALHGTYAWATGIELYWNDFATITKKLQAAKLHAYSEYLTLLLTYS